MDEKIKQLTRPPEDFDGILWPSIDDQIELIVRRRDQIGRVLSFYKGKEVDFENLSREHCFLSAVVHTLKGVKALTA